MSQIDIGILHPGAMGISVAASARNTGHTVCWTSENRSAETRRRAEEQGLHEIKTLAELCDRCSVIISVCPPHAATDVAEAVLACSYSGTYADVNAVSPVRAAKIKELMDEGGIDFVDGGIIGGPAWKPGTTWLYLSGVHADRIAACFSAGPLETCVIGKEIGKASALKMCYAANTKGSTALMCAVAAAAEQLGVRDALEQQWSRDGDDVVNSTHERLKRVTAKAWRFAGEMDEIADTFEDAGQPGGFHRAARDVYDRIARFKGRESLPGLDEVLSALRGDGKEG